MGQEKGHLYSPSQILTVFMTLFRINHMHNDIIYDFAQKIDKHRLIAQKKCLSNTLQRAVECLYF